MCAFLEAHCCHTWKFILFCVKTSQENYREWCVSKDIVGDRNLFRCFTGRNERITGTCHSGCRVPKMIVSVSWQESGEITGTRAIRPKKTVLDSTSDKDCFVSSETKHDKRMVLRVELFVSAWTLQDQSKQPRNSVLGLNPGEMFSSFRYLSKIEQL